jgi:hypothetical protein
MLKYLTDPVLWMLLLFVVGWGGLTVMEKSYRESQRNQRNCPEVCPCGCIEGSPCQCAN